MGPQMKKKMGWRAAAAAVLLAASLSGCRMEDSQVVIDTGFEDSEVFRIEDEACSLPEARVLLTNYQNMYASMYGINLWEHKFSDNSLEKYVKGLTISRLANVMAMDLLAEAYEIALTEEEEAEVGKAAQEYYDSLNDAEREYMDVRQKDIETLYLRYGLADKLYAHLTGGVNDEVSDDEARIMEAQQIVVSDEAKAQEIQRQLAEGADFLSVANANNEASETEVTFGREDVPKAVEKVAFSLEDGQVSDAIKTDKGYYFIKCVNHYDQEKTDDNKSVILEKRRKEAFDDVYQEYSETLSSEFNEKLWESVKVEVKKEIATDSFFEVYEKYCDW